MAIEPMATLNRLLVCKLVHNAEWRDESFIIFLHQRFWSSYVSSCHGSNLYQTIKSGTLSKSSTIRFRMIYQLYSNHTYSSRYNGFLSARFLTPCTFCRYSLQYFILKAFEKVNRFGARHQNVLVTSPTLFFQILHFSTITSELLLLQQHTWHHRISLVETNQLIPNFAKKTSKLDLSPNLRSQVRSGQSSSYWVSFDSGPPDKHFGTHFVCLSPLVQKLWAEE